MIKRLSNNKNQEIAKQNPSFQQRDDKDYKDLLARIVLVEERLKALETNKGAVKG